MTTVQIEGDQDQHPEHPVFDARDLASGKIDLSQLKILEHHVEVFDLMSSEDRARYSELYTRLAEEAKAGKVYIMANVRETLKQSDGSDKWFRYMEWVDFDISGILGA